MKDNDSSGKIMVLSLAIVAIVGVAFSGTAFRIDDPLFIWTAERIVANPFDPYGFTVNWYGVDMKMSHVTQNPPLVAYYQGLIAYFWGWGERAMHLAFIVPALLCVVAVYCLADTLGIRQGLAPLFMVVSPVFLLSSTTVMSDMWLTGFWCLACFFWIKGVQSNTWWNLMLGACFSGLAALSKYFGLACPLLLLAYGIAKRPRSLSWYPWMLVPLAMVVSWSQLSEALYGSSHVANAALYAGFRINLQRLIGNIVTALAFLGGCSLFPAVLLARRGWKRADVFMAMALIAAFATIGAFSDALGGFHRRLFIHEAILFSVFAALGAWVVWHTVMLFMVEKTPEHLMIVLWVLGTVIFVAALNWTVAGRNILPLIPATAIVVAKILMAPPERLRGRGAKLGAITAVTISFLLAFAVTWSDSALANSARDAAEEIARESPATGGTLRFQGHWGFQYYMQAHGAIPYRRTELARWKPEELLVIPTNNSNVTWPDLSGPLIRLKTYQYAPNVLLATMASSVGAGFYSSIWGPLPFSVGTIEPEQYHLFADRRVWRVKD